MIIDLENPAAFVRGHFYDTDRDRTFDPRNFLFFDMETTGLGGSGTVAFLIGFGSIDANGFQVRQYFLPDFPDEEAMLEAVRKEITPDSVIVSYNGRAFDMPILADRLIIQRVERNLEYADHIDLLYPTRRLFRRRLQDCTLSNVERNVLDFHREDDVPGYLVPSIYFNWLATYEMEMLAKVIEHNINDIVSLFFLMHRISEIQVKPQEKISEPDDVLSLARIMENRREHENLCKMLESFDDITWGHRRFDILYLQSLSYKRSGKFAEAVELWTRIVRNKSPEAFRASIELAKYFEHRAKDPQTALNYALGAEENCPSISSLQSDVRKRINRLTAKISR